MSHPEDDAAKGKAPGKAHQPPPGGAGGKVRPETGAGDPETGTQPDHAQDSHPNQLR